MFPPRPKARSVQQCEIYLDLLAAVMRKAGLEEARKLLPLVVRLRAELEAARAEDALLEELLQRKPCPFDNQSSEGEADYE
ncbi:hypothetical protein DevBK_11670 [Devosia sp. BK]|uniref:hypothetical protein n=1 Tax=Devosia sp. BK TaxID=2871706 RepID=UPI00293B0045|nr:hypothetical protein [Devosia sp. BK]MDV3251992.1 hypothetical protein [Devosia sp. BK]